MLVISLSRNPRKTPTQNENHDQCDRGDRGDGQHEKKVSRLGVWIQDVLQNLPLQIARCDDDDERDKASNAAQPVPLFLHENESTGEVVLMRTQSTGFRSTVARAPVGIAAHLGQVIGHDTGFSLSGLVVFEDVIVINVGVSPALGFFSCFVPRGFWRVAHLRELDTAVLAVDIPSLVKELACDLV